MFKSSYYILFILLIIFPSIVSSEINIKKTNTAYLVSINELDTLNKDQKKWFFLSERRRQKEVANVRDSTSNNGLSAAELTKKALGLWKDGNCTDIALAMEYLETAIKQDPNYAKAYHNRGIVWANRGDYERAILDYTKAIHLNSKNATAYFQRANAWANRNDFDKAIIDYTKAIKINPRFSEAYGSRGNTWTDKGNYEQAIFDYGKVIELNPFDGIAYNNRGFVWFYKGYYDKSCDDWQKACERKICSGYIWSKENDICR